MEEMEAHDRGEQKAEAADEKKEGKNLTEDLTTVAAELDRRADQLREEVEGPERDQEARRAKLAALEQDRAALKTEIEREARAAEIRRLTEQHKIALARYRAKAARWVHACLQLREQYVGLRGPYAEVHDLARELKRLGQPVADPSPELNSNYTVEGIVSKVFAGANGGEVGVGGWGRLAKELAQIRVAQEIEHAKNTVRGGKP